jgi:hypothetical protein
MVANQILVRKQINHHPHRRELQGQHEITPRLLKYHLELVDFLAAHNDLNGHPLSLSFLFEVTPRTRDSAMLLRLSSGSIHKARASLVPS